MEPRIRFQGIDSPTYVSGGTTNSAVLPARQAGNRFLGSFKGLQIRAQPDKCINTYSGATSTAAKGMNQRTVLFAKLGKIGENATTYQYALEAVCYWYIALRFCFC
jgi:hypothetical protein